MKIWIDTEFNGYQGDFISIGLVDENDKTFYAAVECAFVRPWVLENVIPVLGTIPQLLETIQTSLECFLMQYDSIHLIADWPEDIAYFCKLLITGPGTRLNTPPLTIEIKRNLDGAVSLVPHNALQDAIAIKKEDLRLNEPNTASNYERALKSLVFFLQFLKADSMSPVYQEKVKRTPTIISTEDWMRFMKELTEMNIILKIDEEIRLRKLGGKLVMNTQKQSFGKHY